MKFIADAMLGRLAKQLRLLGCDVRYDPSAGGNAVLGVALREQRTILTRNHRLAARPLCADHLMIVGDDVADQLRQVLSACPPDETGLLLTRCSRCNTELSPIARADVRDRVPEQVYYLYNVFQECKGCGRLYWAGSHAQRISRALHRCLRDDS